MFNIVLTHGAEIPKKATKLSVGADLKVRGYQRAKEGKILEPIWFDEVKEKEVVVNPHETILLKTGIQIQPKNLSDINEKWIFETEIKPRSGLCLKFGVGAWIGTVEEDYTGDYGVIFLNTTNVPYVVKCGDSVAQLKISACLNISEDIFTIVDSLENTERGEGAYGHSDSKKGDKK